MSEIKNNRNKLWVSFMLLAVVLGSGCSRPKNGDSSSISISLPKTLGEASFGSGGNGAFSAPADSKLAVAIINATGSGIVNPISFNAGRENSNGVVPTDFTIEIPSGSARLIQLLVVYEDPVSNQMFFYYGDVTKDLLGRNVNVEIPISQASTGVIFDGQVSGRYLTGELGGNDVGPTGNVDISIQPPGGKRPMVVETMSIVNGWFSFFMLAGVDFKYTVRESGLVMWGGPVNLDSTKIKPDSGDSVDFSKRFRVMIPWHKREISSSSGTYETGDPRIYSWGFWAHPGALTNISGKSVCTDTDLEDSDLFQELKLYSNTSTQLEIDVPNTSPYATIPNFAGTQTLPVSYATVYGGTGSTCNASPTYLNHLKVTLPDIDGTGSDQVATFRGIFTPSGTNYFNVTGDPKEISGNLLPGITSVIDGFRLFKRFDSSNNGMREINCAKIAALRDDFQPASSGNGTITGNTFTITSNITAEEGTAGVGVVICPVKNGKVLNFGGVYLRPGELGYSGGGGD